MLSTYIFACIVTYLYGSIPFSLLIGFLYGVDLREVSSGNIGARNLGRNCGTLAFFLGFLLDGSKGLFAFILANFLGINPIILFLAAITGHCFSCFIKFKGGKGVSTSIVFALFYAPIPTIIALIVFIVCMKFSKYLSLSAIISTFTFCIVGLFFFTQFEMILSFIAFFGVVLIYRKSIIKIIKGIEEKSDFI